MAKKGNKDNGKVVKLVSSFAVHHNKVWRVLGDCIQDSNGSVCVPAVCTEDNEFLLIRVSAIKALHSSIDIAKGYTLDKNLRERGF